MHRRLVKSLATMMGAAALLVAPIALIAPSAQAAHVLTPDEYAAGTPGNNNEATWEAFLEAEGFETSSVRRMTRPTTRSYPRG